MTPLTKFLGKISQFKFLVMTEKNIFQILIYFNVKIATRPEKSYPLSPSNPSLKLEVLLSPPFWKFGWRFSPPPSTESRGAHYVHAYNVVVTINAIALLSFIK